MLDSINRSGGVLFPMSDQACVLFKMVSWIITSLQEKDQQFWSLLESGMVNRLYIAVCVLYIHILRIDFAHMSPMDVSSQMCCNPRVWPERDLTANDGQQEQSSPGFVVSDILM